MRKLTILFFTLILGLTSVSQENDSIYFSGVGGTVDYVFKGRRTKYHNMVDRVKRVYPYVLEAQKLYSQYAEETSKLKKKTKLRKYGRKQNKILKDEFTYAFKNMSRRDGVVMMKLIEHTTGETVYEIIKKYRGKTYANSVNSLGKLFDQDFKTTLKPNEDRILLKVYDDYLEGKIELPTEVKKMTKEEHEAKKKAARKRRKEFKKKLKIKNRAIRKKKREDKKKN